MAGILPKVGRKLYDKLQGRKQVSKRYMYGDSLGNFFFSDKESQINEIRLCTNLKGASRDRVISVLLYIE